MKILKIFIVATAILLSGNTSAETLLGSRPGVANPQIEGDPSTGIYSAGSGLVDIAVSGSNVAEFSASGLNLATPLPRSEGGSSAYPCEASGLSSSASASANTTALNSCATNHRSFSITTPGTYQISGSTILPSNTHVYIGPGVVLKETGSHPYPFFYNQHFLPTLHAVSSITYAPVGTLSATHMVQATVTYTTDVPNDVSVGQYILIDGDPNLAANGGHLVNSVNTSAKTVGYLIGNNTSNAPNNTASIASASFTGTISVSAGNPPTLTVTLASGGSITVGQNIIGSGVAPGTTVIARGTGTGGNGTYYLSKQQTSAISSGTAMTTIAQQIVSSTADANIAITGTGTLNGNFSASGMTANGSGGTYMDHAILLNNVIRPFVGGGADGFLTINDLSQFCVYISRADTPWVVGIHSDGTPKDGVHYVGPVFGPAHIERLTGTYGDDGAAFENSPNYSYIPVLPYAALNGTYIYGGNFYEGGVMRDIKPTSNGNVGAAVIYPSNSMGGTYIGATAFRMYGRYDIINSGHKEPAGGGDAGAGFGLGGGYSYDAGFVDEINVDGVSGGITLNNAGPNKTIYVGSLSIKNWSNYYLNDYLYPVVDYVNIDKAIFDFDIYNNATSAGFSVIKLASSNAVFGELIFTGKVNDQTAAGINVLSSSGGTVNILKFEDLELLGYTQLLDTSSTFSTASMIVIDDVDASACYNYLFGLGTTTSVNIYARDVRANNSIFNLYSNNTTVNMDFANINTGGNALFINSETNLTLINPQNIYATQRATPANNGTVTLNTNWGYQRQVIAPTASIANLILQMPKNPIDGEVVDLKFTQAITTGLTTQYWNAGSYATGNIITGLNSGSTITSGYSRSLRYSKASSMWE